MIDLEMSRVIANLSVNHGLYRMVTGKFEGTPEVSKVLGFDKEGKRVEEWTNTWADALIIASEVLNEK